MNSHTTTPIASSGVDQDQATYHSGLIDGGAHGYSIALSDVVSLLSNIGDAQQESQIDYLIDEIKKLPNWQSLQPNSPVDGSNIEESGEATKQLFSNDKQNKSLWSDDSYENYPDTDIFKFIRRFILAEQCSDGININISIDDLYVFMKLFTIINPSFKRSSQQVSAVELLEEFVNACYTGCSKDELDLLRQEGEDILKLHNK